MQFVVLSYDLFDPRGELLVPHNDVPSEKGEEFPLHLVDLAQLEESLADDLPALVGVGVVHRDLGREHDGREEESMRGCGTPSRGRVSLLELAEEEEGLVDDREGQAGAVQAIALRIKVLAANPAMSESRFRSQYGRAGKKRRHSR